MVDGKETMEELLLLDKYYWLWLLLTQTRSAIFKARQKKVGQYLHPSQAAALIVIWALNGQATPAVLSRHLFLERHSASELVTRMEKKGLVSKNKDKKIRNIVRITITKKGREVCYQAMRPDFIRRIMSSLTEEQREQLRSCLQILLSETLNELGMEGEMPLPTED
jgi:DNA-binding MarR family transcriptional regulator